MKCALEIAVEVAEKQRIAEEERKAHEAKELAKALEKFQRELSKIDALVEKALIDGNGSAEIFISNSWHGLVCFEKKSYRYNRDCPYWSNDSISCYFPFDTYVEYLREHCFKVEITYRPFTAYSSTLKSERRMPGKTLKISIDSSPECLK